MTLKNLIKSLFNSKKELIHLNGEISDRLDQTKSSEYSFLNGETFIEYVFSGSSNLTSKYSFCFYLNENFKKTYTPKLGDLFVIKSAKQPLSFYFEGVISKQEGNKKYITYKSGSGPYAQIETIPLSEAKSYVHKGMFFEFYRPVEVKKKSVSLVNKLNSLELTLRNIAGESNKPLSQGLYVA